MPDLSTLKYLVEALRGGNVPGTKPDPYSVPGRGSSTLLPHQMEGYRLHLLNAKAMGETPLPYNEWIKQQPSLAESQE